MGSDFLGTYRAVVVSNADPLNVNRALLLVPQVLGPATSDWAMPLTSYARKANVGEVVYASFEGGDLRYPVWSSPTVQAYIPPPPGWFARSTITSNTPALAPGNSQTVVSISGTLGSGTYEIIAHWHGVVFATPGTGAADNKITLSIQRNGTTIATTRILGQAASGFGQAGGTIAVSDTPGAGAVTYAFVLNHETASLAATGFINASATQPAYIYGKLIQ